MPITSTKPHGYCYASSAEVQSPTATWAKDQKTLIVIELAGGNDGLNTFIPYQDAHYLRLRPRIGIKDGIFVGCMPRFWTVG